MATKLTQSIYDVTRRIPRGRVATYGLVALLAGNPRAARAVGFTLHRNPEPGLIPCHRVVFRVGSVCTGFAFGGPEIQRALLEAEGVPFLPDGRVDIGALLLGRAKRARILRRKKLSSLRAQRP
jgi:methylated-DNA-protein-cysteine methyltransferase-like protein